MNGIIIFIGVLFILFLGRSIFTPILLATFIWYLINSISAYYRRAMPHKKCAAWDVTAFTLSLATVGGLIYAFITRIRPMFGALIARLPEIQQKLQMIVSYTSNTFGINMSNQIVPNFANIATNVGISAAGAAATFGLVLVYILFMFVEQSTFAGKIRALFPDVRRFKKMNFILDSISTNMKKYMFMKTFIAAATAVLGYFWMKYLGLEFASVWAFIIFILNYIPTFGAIIATILPVAYAAATAPNLTMPLLVAAGLIALEIIFSNLLEPKLTGKTLNLSTLAILINLVFWGMIWGPVGMFFSVPLLVAVFIITAQFDRTRWIAILLSADGSIPDKTED